MYMVHMCMPYMDHIYGSYIWHIYVWTMYILLTYVYIAHTWFMVILFASSHKILGAQRLHKYALCLKDKAAREY